MIVQKTTKPSFFLIMSWVGFMTALIGFAKTFFIPMAKGSFAAPAVVHIHGAFAFAWVILFVVQASLIHVRRYQLHKSLGLVGLLVAIGVTVTMVPAALFVVERELMEGLGRTAYSGLLGVITSGLLFLGLVVAGIANRHRPEYHKRLMLLATLVVLWPAWFRFRHYFPSVPHPEIWFALVLADSLIVLAWVWDKLKNGHIHPALGYMGSFVILEQTFEVIAFDSPLYQVVAKELYDLFSMSQINEVI